MVRITSSLQVSDERERHDLKGLMVYSIGEPQDLEILKTEKIGDRNIILTIGYHSVVVSLADLKSALDYISEESPEVVLVSKVTEDDDNE